MTESRTAAEAFTDHRPLLFTVAYEMLGTVADAEDVLQEAWVRWADVDLSTVENPRAYLVRIVTRMALNHLRTVQRRREDYIGNWLPEPVQTVPDIADDVLLAESVSLAMLLVLESLSPAERAVFVLHEVFGYRFTEIARIVDKSEAAVRQIAHRARSHVTARRQRFEPDSEEVREVVGAFLWATISGDVNRLMEVLAPDVVQMSDGGGKMSAARRPVVGREAVARFSIGIARTNPMDPDLQVMNCNGLPGVLLYREGRLDTVLVFEVSGGLIQRYYAIRNPDKLAAIHEPRRLTRTDPI
ncbi:MAG: RNA polymerase sigma-70 factor [Aeromicrobium sp.]|uniref:RNA polymerase sigma-70 factor n=1 Tax=Aeromicrobium sp. TaxID=1871063 RepID=UPI0039E642EF